MDKYTLNGQQLDQLRMFIRRRGFTDDLVVEEILDHFACKVEELLDTEPRLAFDEAVERAHRSFGVSGFRPVVKAFEHQLGSRYRRLFWRNVKQILLSPKYLLALIPAGYLLFQGIAWTELHNYRHIAGINDLTLIIWIAIFIYEIILTRKLTRLPFECYKRAVGVGEFIIAPVMIGFITGSRGNDNPDHNIALAAGFFTLLTMMALIRQLSFNLILKQAKADLSDRIPSLPAANH